MGSQSQDSNLLLTRPWGSYTLIGWCVWCDVDTVEAIQEEVCHSSLFKASCPDGHVMFVQSARYGRFRTSRCITEGLGYLGCETNVLHVIDSLCSGRPSCEVKVEDATFYGVIPCHNDVKSHLSITYSCLKGIVFRGYCLTVLRLLAVSIWEVYRP